MGIDCCAREFKNIRTQIRGILFTILQFWTVLIEFF